MVSDAMHPPGQDEDIVVHKDMSIDELIQASEEQPKAIEDILTDEDERKKLEVIILNNFDSFLMKKLVCKLLRKPEVLCYPNKDIL